MYKKVTDMHYEIALGNIYSGKWFYENGRTGIAREVLNQAFSEMELVNQVKLTDFMLNLNEIRKYLRKVNFKELGDIFSTRSDTETRTILKQKDNKLVEAYNADNREIDKRFNRAREKIFEKIKMGNGNKM
jgi:hypothetical protein